MNRNIEVIAQDANHSSVDWSNHSSGQIKIHSIEVSQKKLKIQSKTFIFCGERKVVNDDPKHMSSSLKHGGGDVMA